MSTDTSTNPNTAFINETPKDERVEIVKNDARKLPRPGEKGDCYMRNDWRGVGRQISAVGGATNCRPGAGPISGAASK